MPPVAPRQKVINAYTRVDKEAPEEWVPKKWELHGDLAVIQLKEGTSYEVKQRVGEAFVKGLNLRIVIEDVGRVGGELRKPQGSIVLARRNEETERETETVHIENRVKYSFDAARIMFSSGNTTERVKMGELTTPGETVVDMFAGIGYFTLPIAKNGGMVHALEKNPVSAEFLVKNAALNGVSDRVHVQNGDNREIGTELLGTADRVSMGFFDGKEDAKPFIPRAISFLKPSGTVHYHYLSTKEAALTTPVDHFSPFVPCLPLQPPQLFSPPLASLSIDYCAMTSMECSPKPVARVVRVRKVKSYRPQVFHYVADVQFELW